ncbi:PQQ-dependent sugar dehydrogenase [Akkermansiaceae bacterium]|nr:PQQ-dependent sugar dehydrogenase [Akkermansiaceae bacterium]
MKKFNCLLALSLTANVALGDTSPSYKVTSIPNPPSKFGTKQIDGLDFLPDGRMVVCQPSGEVFLFNPKTFEWKLFAEGLHNPLGVIAESNTSLIVSQRPEVTRISDTDGDGKADFYQVMTDEFGMSGNYHEFHFTPVKDKEGNYFFSLGTGSSGDGVRSIVRGEFDPRGRPGRMHASTPYRGCVMKLTKDGKTVPWSYGHRTPNGLGFDLEGNLFVTDNQGDWVGSSKLFHVKKGLFYGHAASLTWKPGFEGAPLDADPRELAKMRTRAAVVFPHGSMANSPTQVLAISPEANFGPFTGQLLVGEMNTNRIVRVMLEEVGGELQGACVPFIDGGALARGCNRMAWAPDGSLYVGHTKHSWAGGEGISRVEWNSEVPFEVASMKLTKKGFRFMFTKPVDSKIAGEIANWPFKRYYYKYHKSYGSPQMDVAPVKIDSVEISKDGKSVNVNLEELKAWHIHEVKIKGLKSADGTSLANSYLAYTLNRLLENTPPDPLHVSGTTSPKGEAFAKAVEVIDPEGTVYQVTDAKLKGVRTSSSHEGYTGTCYADFGEGKESIEWTVTSKRSGQGKVLIRYALGSNLRPLNLLVNGREHSTLPFANTGGWKNWKDIAALVELKEGPNTIVLATNGASGGNIDHLQVIEPKS